MAPDTEEIRLELERILNSEAFTSSERHRAFLKFIVDETLAGRGDRIKGYTIAVEVYDKDVDFDAQNDPYVRVEAGRLRKRLDEYYFTEGADNPIRIELKRGSYVPEFVRFQPPGSGASDAPRSRRIAGLSRKGRRVAMAAAVIVAAIALGLIASRIGRDAAVVADGGPPRLRVQLFDATSEDFEYFASGLTTELLIKLDRYRSVWGQINVFPEEDLSQLAIENQHDYILGGSVSRIDDKIHVTARLLNGDTAELLWTEAYDRTAAVGTLFEVQDDIAMAIANAFRDPVGEVAAAEIARITGQPLSSLSPYECNVVFLDVLATMTRTSREAAQACLERHDATDDLDAQGLAALSFLYHLNYRDGVDLRSGVHGLSGGDDLVEQAYDAAQRALDRDGNTLLAHAAMAFVHIDRDRREQARSSAERLMTLNPPPSVRGVAASLLLALGAADEGMSLFEEATGEGQRLSPALYAGPAIYYLGQNQIELALSYAERIDAPEFTMFQVLWAAMTAELGQLDRARRHAAIILEMHPDFLEYGIELIGRWSLPPEVTQKLIDGLRLCGIEFG